MHSPVFPSSIEAVTLVCSGNLHGSMQWHKGQILEKLSLLLEDVLLSLPLPTLPVPHLWGVLSYLSMSFSSTWLGLCPCPGDLILQDGISRQVRAQVRTEPGVRTLACLEQKQRWMKALATSFGLWGQEAFHAQIKRITWESQNQHLQSFPLSFPWAQLVSSKCSLWSAIPFLPGTLQQGRDLSPYKQCHYQSCLPAPPGPGTSHCCSLVSPSVFQWSKHSNEATSDHKHSRHVQLLPSCSDAAEQGQAQIRQVEQQRLGFMGKQHWLYISQNTECFGLEGTFKYYLTSTFLSWARDPSIRPNWSKLHSTWLWTLLRLRQSQLL